jgi:hypothetical protein
MLRIVTKEFTAPALGDPPQTIEAETIIRCSPIPTFSTPSVESERFEFDYQGKRCHIDRRTMDTHTGIVPQSAIVGESD